VKTVQIRVLMFVESFVVLLLEAVFGMAPTGLLRNVLPFLCVPESIKLDVCKICLQKIKILQVILL